MEVYWAHSMVRLYKCWQHGLYAAVLSGAIITQATIWQVSRLCGMMPRKMPPISTYPLHRVRVTAYEATPAKTCRCRDRAVLPKYGSRQESFGTRNWGRTFGLSALAAANSRKA